MIVPALLKYVTCGESQFQEKGDNLVLDMNGLINKVNYANFFYGSTVSFQERNGTGPMIFLWSELTSIYWPWIDFLLG